MKISYRKILLAVAACLILTLSVSTVVYAADIPGTDYRALFDRVKVSGGVYRAVSVFDLVWAYDENAASLIRAMAEYEAKEMEEVVRFLVFGKSYGDLGTFKIHVESLTARGNTDNESRMIKLILDEIDRVQTVKTGYQAIFDRAKVSDGAYSEMVAYDLVCAYDNDAIGLIKAMGEYEPDEMESVARLLVYGKNYGDLNVFKADVENKITEERTDKENRIIKLILDTINLIQTIEESWTTTPDLPPFETHAFSAEIILNFINLQEELGGGLNEELFRVLGNAFRAEPLYFAQIISDRPAESIAYIAKALAYDCINNNEYPDDKAVAERSSGNARENEVLGIIRAAIQDTSNGRREIFFDESMLNTNAPKSTRPPVIGTMSFSTKITIRES